MNRTKTDKQDARLIADYCAVMKPSAWHCPSDFEKRLKSLIALKNQLINMRTAEKNRLQAAKDAFIVNICKSLIATLSEKIESVAAEIDRLFTENAEMAKNRDRLKTIWGIGKTASCEILYSLLCRNFDNVRQYISFLGLCPSEKQSGTSVKGRGNLTRFGSRSLKKAYFMPALVCYRMGYFADFVRRLEAKGKPKMVIIAALMRKLATVAFYVHHYGVNFDESRYTACNV